MNEIRNDTLIIHGDVDSANGDVDYYGKVTVEGSILSGMTVKSTDDMIIKGDVNGGHVNCIGHLLITGGIDGENRSKVVAQKDIKVNFIRNATVKSESGSVYVDADISYSSVVDKRKVVLGA